MTDTRFCMNLGVKDKCLKQGGVWEKLSLRRAAHCCFLGRWWVDRVVGGTLVGFHVLDGKFELLALLVPLVNGHEQQLLVHFAAHDEEVGAQVLQLRARTVGSVLNVQGQFL